MTKVSSTDPAAFPVSSAITVSSSEEALEVECACDRFQLAIEQPRRRPTKCPYSPIVQAVSPILPRTILHERPRLLFCDGKEASEAAQDFDIGNVQVACDVVDGVGLRLCDHRPHRP